MVWWFHILPYFMQIQTKQITSKLTIITCSQKWHLYSSKTWSDTTGIMCIQQRKGHTNINFILFQIGQKLWDAFNRGKFCWDWWYLDMKIKFTLHNQMAKSSISSCISKTFEDKSNHAKICDVHFYQFKYWKKILFVFPKNYHQIHIKIYVIFLPYKKMNHPNLKQ